jgi:hypothetical protein
MIIRPSLSGLFQRNVIPPLDISGMPTARLAYSLRKLRAAYTGYALRVRNSSGTEADVEFYNDKEVTSESMTSAGSTLRDFAGGGDVTVPKWYNQSGNTSTQAGGGSWSGYATAPDAVQTTSGRQPLLMVSGAKTKNALKFETVGGHYAYGDYFQVNNYRLPNSPDDFTLVWAGQIFSFSGGAGLLVDLDNFNDGVELTGNTSVAYNVSVDSHDLASAASQPTDTNMVVIGSYDRSRASAQGGDGNSQILRVNGTETTKDTNEDKHIGNRNRFRIGARKDNKNPIDGTCREAFVWESQLSAALQVALEKNMAVYNEIDL